MKWEYCTVCCVYIARRTHGIKEVLMKIMIRLSSQCVFDHVLIHAVIVNIYIVLALLSQSVIFCCLFIYLFVTFFPHLLSDILLRLELESAFVYFNLSESVRVRIDYFYKLNESTSKPQRHILAIKYCRMKLTAMLEFCTSNF